MTTALRWGRLQVRVVQETAEALAAKGDIAISVFDYDEEGNDVIGCACRRRPCDVASTRLSSDRAQYGLHSVV